MLFCVYTSCRASFSILFIITNHNHFQHFFCLFLVTDLPKTFNYICVYNTFDLNIFFIYTYIHNNSKFSFSFHFSHSFSSSYEFFFIYPSNMLMMRFLWTFFSAVLTHLFEIVAQLQMYCGRVVMQIL